MPLLLFTAPIWLRHVQFADDLAGFNYDCVAVRSKLSDVAGVRGIGKLLRDDAKFLLELIKPSKCGGGES